MQHKWKQEFYNTKACKSIYYLENCLFWHLRIFQTPVMRSGAITEFTLVNSLKDSWGKSKEYKIKKSRRLVQRWMAPLYFDLIFQLVQLNKVSCYEICMLFILIRTHGDGEPQKIPHGSTNRKNREVDRPKMRRGQQLETWKRVTASRHHVNAGPASINLGVSSRLMLKEEDKQEQLLWLFPPNKLKEKYV